MTGRPRRRRRQAGAARWRGGREEARQGRLRRRASAHEACLAREGRPAARARTLLACLLARAGRCRASRDGETVTRKTGATGGWPEEWYRV